MVMLNENNIESFIRKNRNAFSAYRPPENHQDKFFMKLNRRIRHIISIVPYLIRVAIGTLIIFIASIMVWNNYIRKDRDRITLKEKVTLVLKKLTPSSAKD
jgi:hypothetical protein